MYENDSISIKYFKMVVIGYIACLKIPTHVCVINYSRDCLRTPFAHAYCRVVYTIYILYTAAAALAMTSSSLSSKLYKHN